MPDKKKVAIGLGIAGLAVLGVYLATREVEAKPPPEGYICPYCGATFATYEELVTHVQTEHPGERIPIDIIWE